MQTILVLEDYQEVRQWLGERLSSAFIDTQVFEAATIAQAKELLNDRTYDLAIVDLNLPDGKGTEFITFLSKVSPNTYCVVATAFDDDEHLFPALKAGAKGYLLKDQTDEEFTNSLRGILHGEPAISPVIARKLITHFHQQPESTSLEGLSDRESEILALTAKGFTRNEIAKDLKISPNTVASHLKNIYSKLNVTNRAEATLQALRLKLIQ